MAYQEYSITSLAEAPALIAAFATTMGWDVAGTVLRHPNYNGAGPGGLAFTISHTASGLNHDLIWSCTTGHATSVAFIRSPILSTNAAPTVGVRQSPTKLFLIGMLTPQPYIAAVVEYGFNLYRHLYLGYMEKHGSYNGGAVISADNGPLIPVNATVHFLDRSYNQRLFQGHQGHVGATSCGGVYIDSPDNPVPWRLFRDQSSQPANGDMSGITNGSEVYGGMGDDINDNFVIKGKSSIAGANVLTPFNLMVTREVGTDFRLRPIGRPSGVRMINIQEIEPRAQIEVGGENYYSFAASSKQNTPWSYRPGDTGSRYRLSEASYYLGYAYRG